MGTAGAIAWRSGLHDCKLKVLEARSVYNQAPSLLCMCSSRCFMCSVLLARLAVRSHRVRGPILIEPTNQIDWATHDSEQPGFEPCVGWHRRPHIDATCSMLREHEDHALSLTSTAAEESGCLQPSAPPGARDELHRDFCVQCRKLGRTLNPDISSNPWRRAERLFGKTAGAAHAKRK